MKQKVIVAMIYCAIIISCHKTNEKASTLIEIFNSDSLYFTPHAAFGLKKDTLFLLTDIWNHFQTSRSHNYGYSIFTSFKDSLLFDSTKVNYENYPILPDIKNKNLDKPLNPWNEKIRDLDIYIYDLYQLSFKYDKIPDTISKLFPSIVQIYNGKRYYDTSKSTTASLYLYKDSILACYVADTSFRKLFVYDFTTKSRFSIGIESIPGCEPNFLLYNISGSKRPEIFLFYSAMSDYLTFSQLKIYKVIEE